VPELQQCSCHQISIETAQSNLDCSVLSSLARKKVMLGVIDLSDCGMKYLLRDVAFGKMKAMVDGASIVREELKLGT
jgi:5-methyltetrahydropteroyltriglutamate--homocysteine methyltransferase